MLSDEELLQLCQRLNLSAQAQQVIEAIRASPPVRRVGNGRGNVSVRYPSRKMGQVIQAESHKNELAGIYEKEYDRETLEYYDQPSQIKLEYQAKSGRKVGVIHTPDFFVIRTDGIGWEEWKTEEELIELSERMPHRYNRGAETGRWHCPPGERYAERLGLFYRVRSSAEINWILQRNLHFLEDYLRDNCPEVSAGMTEQIIGLVNHQPGIKLAELLHQIEPRPSDELYRLIATGEVYVDLAAAPLPEPERVQVFRDATIAQAYQMMTDIAVPGEGAGPRTVELEPGQGIIWDGYPWTIVNVGQTMISLLEARGTRLVELPWTVFESLVQQGKIVGRSNLPKRSVKMDTNFCARPAQVIYKQRTGATRWSRQS